MKLKIKVKALPDCMPKIIEKGDWVDLCSCKTFDYNAPYADRLTKNKTVRKVNFETVMVPLGVCMKLPAGFEAVVLPRSSSFKNFGFIVSNSEGVIDNSYCGNNDEWKLPIVPLMDGHICAGDRVCQFRIQLSQKATFWQKFRWLFSNGIEFVEVEEMDDNNRSGFGSTGM